MASGNGGWSPTTGSGNRGRLTWDISQSPSSVGSGTSSVSLRLRVWYESRYSISDSSNSYTISGAWSGSGSRSINHGGSGGRTVLYDGTITVSTSYAGTVSRSFTASFSGINATPNIPNVSATHRVARRPISAPNAPTGVSATRVSDAQASISWRRNTTTARPYETQRVQRRWVLANGEWGLWTNSGAVAGTATGASVATTANNSYQFRVVAQNSAGSSGSGASAVLRTTPSAPSTVVAKKLVGGDIRVSFNKRFPDNSGVRHELQDSPDGGAWVTVATQNGSGDFIVTSPDPLKTHRYRVRTVVPVTGSSAEVLRSSWSSPSGTVQLLSRPNPPTLVSPVGVWDVERPVTFTWIHNSVDSSEQTRRHIERRRVGTETWLLVSNVTSGEETYTTGVDYGIGDWEWRARTWGAHDDPSEWSQIERFSTEYAPSVVVNAPGAGTLAQSRVDLEFSYFHPDDSPQARVQANLVHEGVVLESLNWAGSSTVSQFRTVLEDAKTYSVRVRVQAGNGLWSSWETVTFVTSFPMPVAFEVTPQWDRETGAVLVTGSPVDTVLATYEWDGRAGYATSTRTTWEDAFTNTFTNPNFKGGVGVVTVWENLIPSSKPSYSTTRYTVTNAEAVQSGENYREIRITADVTGGTTFHRCSQTNGHTEIAPGETYTGRVGVGNPNSYPITVRAGFLRTTTAAVALGSSVSANVQIPAGGYEEILIPPYEIDANWNIVRLGLVAPDGETIPAGSLVHVYDGFTVTRGTECPHLIHGDMPLGERAPDLWGEWYSARYSTPSRLVGYRVHGVTAPDGVKAVRSTEWGREGSSLLVSNGVADPFGLEFAGRLPEVIRNNNLVEGVDYTITERIGNTLPQVAILSFHGGDIERGSSEPANEIAQQLDATWWDLDGHINPSGSESWDLLHISSSNFGHQGLLDLLADCEYAVSFHGSTDWRENITSPGAATGVPYSFIGGANEQLRTTIATALRGAGFLCDTNPENFPDFPGDGPANLVQQTRSRSGVQIEMSNAQRRAFFVGNDYGRDNRGNTTAAFDAYVAAVVSGIQTFILGSV